MKIQAAVPGLFAWTICALGLPATIPALHAANGTAGFAITGPASPTIVQNGETGAYLTMTITPQDGFTGGIQLDCAVSATPSGAKYPPVCAGGPVVRPSITITSASSVPYRVPIILAGQAVPVGVAATTEWPLVAGIVSMFLLLQARRRGATLLRAVASVGVLLCSVAIGSDVLSGCGADNGPQTTPGNYTILVAGTDTATGLIKASGTAIVTVR